VRDLKITELRALMTLPFRNKSKLKVEKLFLTLAREVQNGLEKSATGTKQKILQNET